MNYGGFWIRFLAYFIDGIILTIVPRLIFRNLCMGMNYCLGDQGYEIGSIAIPLIYFFVFWVWKGATPGKMICKLQIVDENGNKITWQRAALRLVGYFVSTITLCIGFIMIGFDAKKQGLHDKIAKTYVIKTS